MVRFYKIFICSHILIIFINCSGNKKEESNLGLVQESSNKVIDEPTADFNSLVDETQTNDTLNAIIEQYTLLLDNEEGVPYYEDELGTYIEGFDVDRKGDLYFMGGIENDQLVKFSNTTLVFRKVYESIDQSALHHINDSVIVLLNTKYGKNELFWIRNRDGNIITDFGKILDNIINSYNYTDSCIIVEPFNQSEEISTSTELGFVKFDLQGNLLGQVQNRYGAPSRVVNARQDSSVFKNDILGVWQDKYVKLTINEKSQYNILLINSSGDIEKSYSIPLDKLGEPLWGDSDEHNKLVNNKLYLLHQKGSDAVVTILSLEQLFS